MTLLDDKTRKLVEALGEIDAFGIFWIDNNGDPHLNLDKAARVFDVPAEDAERLFIEMAAKKGIKVVKVDHRERGQ